MFRLNNSYLVTLILRLFKCIYVYSHRYNFVNFTLHKYMITSVQGDLFGHLEMHTNHLIIYLFA